MRSRGDDKQPELAIVRSNSRARYYPDPHCVPSLRLKAVKQVDRREFLELSAGAAALSMFAWPRSVGAQPVDGWNLGQVVHLIPTANQERTLKLKSLTG